MFDKACQRLFILLVFLSSSHAISQRAWEFVSPATWGTALHAVVFLAPDELVAVGEYGIIVHSGDTARTWQNVHAEYDARFVDVAWDGARLLAMEEQGSLRRSDDRGMTWFQAGQLPASGVRSLCAAAPGVWVAIGKDGLMLRSGDGGNTWQRITLETQRDINGIAFVDALHGMCVGMKGFAAFTTDGGLSWKTHALPFTEDLASVCWPSPERIHVSGKNTLILRSLDGGQTWANRGEPWIMDAGLMRIDETGLGLVKAKGLLTYDEGNLSVLQDGERNSPVEDIESFGGVFQLVGRAGMSQTRRRFLRNGVPGMREWWVRYRRPPTTGNVVARGAKGNTFALFADADASLWSSDLGESWNRIEGAAGKAGGAIAAEGLFDIPSDWAIGRYAAGGGKPRWFGPLTFSGGQCAAIPADGHIVIGGQGGGAYAVSEDAGRHWHYRLPHTSQSFRMLSFIDDSVGFAAVESRREILRTTDAGERWTTVPGSPPDYVDALHFFSESDGLIYHGGTISRTTDGGVTFSPLSSLGAFYMVDGIFATGRDSLILLPEWYSHDGAATWNRMAGVSVQHLARHPDGSLLATMSGRGILLRSWDFAASWDTIDITDGYTGYYTNVASGRGFICAVETGRNELLIHSGGDRGWHAVLQLPGIANVALDCGGDSTIFLHSSSIRAVSTDRGISWHIDTLLTPTGLKGIACWDSTAAVVGMAPGYVLQSSDRWQSFDVLTHPLPKSKFRISRLRDGRIAVPGSLGRLMLLGRDGAEQRVDTGVDGDVTVCEQLPSGAIIVGGTKGRLAVSYTPDALSWEQLHNIDSADIRDISFADNRRGMFVTPEGRVFHTTNGGSDWKEGDRAVGTALNVAMMFDAENVLAAGDAGVVLRSSSGGLVSVEHPGKSDPDVASAIALEVFPQPARELLQLRITVPARTPIDIRLHDILGRMRAQILSTELDAGVHTLSHHLGGLPSGSYIVSANAGSLLVSRCVTVLTTP